MQVPGWPVSPGFHPVPSGKGAVLCGQPTAASLTVATAEDRQVPPPTGVSGGRSKHPASTSLRALRTVCSVSGRLPALRPRLTRTHLRLALVPCASESWYVYRASDSPGLCAALALAEPLLGRGDRGGGEHRERPFPLERGFLIFSANSAPPSTHPPPAYQQASQFPGQEARTLWGQVERQQDPEPSGCLFLGACGHCRPCWVHTAVPVLHPLWQWSRATLCQGT